MWAPGLRLPTHTAQIHKSLSWLSDGAKRDSVSLVQVKKKLRWWGHRTDNECFWNLSKGPLSLDDSAPTWLDFDIYKRKARPFLQSQGTTIWSQSWHTWPESEPATCSLTHWEYPDLSPFTKLNVTSHCKDTEQNSSMEGGMDRRKAEMKGGTRMSQWVYCFFCFLTQHALL